MTDQPGSPWDHAYRSAARPPWDIGRPQGAFVRLADDGTIEPPVLDAGCGSGAHALFLASRGLEVVGIDISPVAIERARDHARQRAANVTFEVHDVLDLGSLGRTFRTVVDSGLFHVFDDPGDVARYVDGLRAIVEPGGAVHLMCFSELQPGTMGPRRVSRAEIRAAFADGWSVESIVPATFEVNPPMGDARAWLARIVRTRAAPRTRDAEGMPMTDSARATPVLRVATATDVDAIDALMKASIRALFPAWYDERQTASSVIHIGSVDRQLVEDGTYYVVEAAGELVACGGWSRRDKLFTGSAAQEGKARLLDPATEPARVRAMFVRGDWTRRGLGTRILEAAESAARAEGFRTLALMATLPGHVLYERYGFREVSRGDITLPDGVLLECVAMEKRIG